MFQKQPPEVFCMIRCSWKLHKIHRKHLCQSLFLMCFPVNFANFLRTPLDDCFSCFENKATKLLDYLQKRWIGKLENFTEESNAQIRKLLIGAIFEIRNTENIQNQFIGLYSFTIIQTSRYLEILYVVGICEQRTLLSGPICAYC